MYIKLGPFYRFSYIFQAISFRFFSCWSFQDWPQWSVPNRDFVFKNSGRELKEDVRPLYQQAFHACTTRERYRLDTSCLALLPRALEHTEQSTNCQMMYQWLSSLEGFPPQECNGGLGFVLHLLALCFGCKLPALLVYKWYVNCMITQCGECHYSRNVWDAFSHSFLRDTWSGVYCLAWTGTMKANIQSWVLNYKHILWELDNSFNHFFKDT